MKKSTRSAGPQGQGEAEVPGTGGATGSPPTTAPPGDAPPASFFEAVLELSSIGYATLSRNGTVEEINRVGARLLGQPRSQLIGRRFAVLAASISRDAVDALIRKASAASVGETCDIEVDPRLGGALHLRLAAALLTMGQRPAVLLVLSDITETKVRETKMVEAVAAASAAIRRKDEFLAGLSHGLRDLLAPIRNCLFVLAREAPGGDREAWAKRVIDRSVRQLNRIVDDLVDLTHTSRGKVGLRRAPVDLVETVRTVTEHLGSDAVARGVACRLSLPQGSLWVYADVTRLSEAVATLVGNVERFTPAGGRVVVTLQRNGGRADLRVTAEIPTSADAGDEAEPEVGAFVAAAETVERACAAGLGFGLAMLKGELALQGGAVEMETDERGRGRAIVAVLPLEDAASPAGSESACATPRAKRVLIIEDVPDAADSLRDALRLVGHQVEVTYDGPSGIARARELRPDIVICDIGMPGMDGYAVARAFRSDPDLRSAHLVALTGHAGRDSLERARNAGFDDHVAKPATIEALQSLLCKDHPVAGAPKG